MVSSSFTSDSRIQIYIYIKKDWEKGEAEADVFKDMFELSYSLCYQEIKTISGSNSCFTYKQLLCCVPMCTLKLTFNMNTFLNITKILGRHK